MSGSTYLFSKACPVQNQYGAGQINGPFIFLLFIVLKITFTYECREILWLKVWEEKWKREWEREREKFIIIRIKISDVSIFC